MLHCVFVAAHWPSLVKASRGYSSSRATHGGGSCFEEPTLGMQAQHLWFMALVALLHVESSQIRDQTHVPCIGGWIPIHCTTREIQ